MNNKEINKEIALKLLDLIEKYPSLRFSQILSNFDFVTFVSNNEEMVWKDEYYESPEVILDRVIEAVARLNE